VLSNETMGAFCLGVVWLNTLLIVAHVLQAWRGLGRERAALAQARAAGELVEVNAAEPVGEVVVRQVGRAITSGGPETILFTDAERRAKIAGGEVEAGGDRITLEPTDACEVWTLDAAGVRSPDTFAEAYQAASTNKGLTAELRMPVRGRLWVRGRREGDRVRCSLVSDREPIALLGADRAKALAFVVLALAVLGGCTALALVRPLFSGWSTLGGMTLVGYFLAVQPLAVALRESIALPSARLVGGRWTR
jgi:hypothetical protein